MRGLAYLRVMKREFIISVALTVATNLLVKSFYIFGIDRTVQNRTGPEAYGLYFALLSFTLLFQVVNDFGIHLYQSRNVARHPHLLGKLLPNTLLLKGLLAAVFALLVVLAAWLAGYSGVAWELLGWLIAVQVLHSLFQYLCFTVTGLGYYRLNGLLSVVDRLVLIGLMGCLLWMWPAGREFDVLWLVQAQVVSLVIAVGVVAAMVWRRLPRGRLHVRGKLVRVVLRQSAPFALAVFLMTVYTRLDAVVLERLLPEGDYAAGVYASAYRLLDAANMAGALFAGLLLPMFSTLMGRGEAVRPLADLAFRLLMSVAVAAAVACTLFRHELMQLLYAHATFKWGQVLGWLIWSFVATSGMYIYGTVLTAAGRLGVLNRLFALSIALNFFCNWLLIPRYGPTGAAGATVATQAFVWVAEMWLAHRLEHSGPYRGTLLRLAVLAALLVVTGCGARAWVPSWPLALLLMSVSLPLWAAVSGLWRLGVLRKLIAMGASGRA